MSSLQITGVDALKRATKPVANSYVSVNQSRQEGDNSTLFLVCRNLPHSSPSMPAQITKSRTDVSVSDVTDVAFSVAIITISMSHGRISLLARMGWKKSPQSKDLQLKFKNIKKTQWSNCCCQTTAVEANKKPEAKEARETSLKRLNKYFSLKKKSTLQQRQAKRQYKGGVC